MVNKITNPPTQKELVDKTNEIIDNLAGGQGGLNRNIGEIITSTIPLTDAGLHLLDGSLLSYGSYADFIDYIASIYDASANYFCTEADWQTSATTYGVCGKFVYDSANNTVRLPKYGSKLYTSNLANTAPVKGNGKTLGLTDGTNTAGLILGASGTYAGFLIGKTNMYNTDVGTAQTGSNITSGKGASITTEADKSGIIADISNIVAPLDCYYYIVIANSTKTEIQVDIDEIATDLNGKADVDLSNISASLSAINVITGWSLPDYDNGISYTYSTANTAQTYTMPDRGYFYYTVAANQGTGTCISLNGNTVVNYKHWSSSGGGEMTGVLAVDKNDVISLTSAYISTATTGFPYLKFFPMKAS